MEEADSRALWHMLTAARSDGRKGSKVPRVESVVHVDVSAEIAFAVSMTTGSVRLRWDPFIRDQHHLDGAERSARGVRTLTTSRHGFKMVSEFTSFKPPTRVGMRMVDGPWFFHRFGGGWAFDEIEPGRTRATWMYAFQITPGWLARVADPVGITVLQRDIDKRIAAWANGCRDPIVLEAARELATHWS